MSGIVFFTGNELFILSFNLYPFIMLCKLLSGPKNLKTRLNTKNNYGEVRNVLLNCLKLLRTLTQLRTVEVNYKWISFYFSCFCISFLCRTWLHTAFERENKQLSCFTVSDNCRQGPVTESRLGLKECFCPRETEIVVCRCSQTRSNWHCRHWLWWPC
jgi:hypothetical protein